MAYDKYQEHQAQKRPIYIQQEPESETSGRASQEESEKHLDDINSEVMERAGISPPSYNSVMNKPYVTNRSHRAQSVTSSSSFASSSSSVPTIFTPPTTVVGAYEDRNNLTDGENELGRLSASRSEGLSEMNASQVESVPTPGAGDRQLQGEWANKKEMKRALKAARKAEKWAMKAKAMGYVF